MANQASPNIKPSTGQWLVVGFGLLVFVSLFFADRTVLENSQPNASRDAQVAEGNGNGPQPGQGAADALPEPLQLPPASLGPEASAKLQTLQKASAEATSLTDSIRASENLAAFYSQQNLGEHAAMQHAMLATWDPKPERSLAAATQFRDAAQQPPMAQNAQLRGRLNDYAIFWYQQYVAARPNDRDAALELALREVESQNPMAGIQKLVQIVNEDTLNYRANLSLGLFSVRTNQPEKAQARFRRAIIAAPAQAEPYFHLGSLLVAQPRTRAEGLRLLKKARLLARDPRLQADIDQQIAIHS